MSEISDQRPLQLSRKAKFRVATALSVLAAIPAAAGFTGYKIGEASANSSRGSHIATAKRDKDCIKLEREHASGNHPVIVSLGSLTTRQRVDCGVNWASSADINSLDYNTSEPQGTVVKGDVVVKLPSISRLNENAHHEYAQAANPYSTISGIGNVLIGGVIGFGVDMAVLSGIGYIEERRNSSPTPESAEAGS